MRDLLEKTLVVNELDVRKHLKTAAAAGLIGAGAFGLGYQKGIVEKPVEKPAMIAPADPVIKEWQIIRMEVTAYCPCVECTGRSSPGITASGHKIQGGDAFVAADERYDFGTRMIIPGYGDGQPVEVLDRGGAIQGDRVDVFFPTHEEAVEWGVQTLDVKVQSE